MAYNLPIYKRGNNFVVHIRVFGKQFKRSLKTTDPVVAAMRASQLLAHLETMFKNPNVRNFGWIADFNSGVFSAEPGDDSEDFRKGMAALENASKAILAAKNAEHAAATSPNVPASLPIVSEPKSQLVIKNMMDEYIQNAQLKPVTKTDYESYAKQIDAYWPKKLLADLTDQDVTTFISHLRSHEKNSGRTVDNKVGFLRAVFNYAKKFREYEDGNPAECKNLVSKKQKRNAGAKRYGYNDLATVFGGEKFYAFCQNQRSLYWVTMIGLITGMRVSSVCSLKRSDLKISIDNTPHIDVDSDKTAAGTRLVPIPKEFFDPLAEYLDKNNGFGFQARDEKGYSDVIRKPTNKFRELNGFVVNFPKLSYHSLRKSLTTYLLQQKVPAHICSAMIGHEDNSMTTGVYGAPPSVDEIGHHVLPHLKHLLKVLNFKAA
ncbi:MAG: tyrosine-type recombinase/integrase [Limnohabitans sp.]